MIVPLNVLQRDQLHNLTQHGISAVKLTQSCKAFTLNQGEEVSVPLSDVVNGSFRVIMAHPEALLKSAVGVDLLCDNQTFQRQIVAICTDECHKIETW